MTDPIEATERPTVGAPEDASLLDDLRGIRNLAGYALGALKRRRRSMVIIFAAVAILGSTAGLLKPKNYVAGFRVHTERSYIIPNLVNNRRSIPLGADSPTRGVYELMFSRDFLHRVIDVTGLKNDWGKDRGFLATTKTWVMNALRGKPTGDQLRGALRKMLEKRLKVNIDGSLIRVEVSWGSPELATRIASATLEEFLHHMRENELDQIRETINILEERVAASQVRLNETADRLETTIKEKEVTVRQRLSNVARSKSESRTWSFRRASGGQKLSPEGREMQRALNEVRLRISRLDAVNKREVQAAEKRLETLRETLGPAHPDYKQATRDLKTVAATPVELKVLRDEESRLQKQVAGAQGVSRPQEDRSRFEVVQVPMTGDVYAALVADPDVESLMTELRKYVQNHNDLLDRHQSAQDEVETAKAAFRYRYVVTQPPALPERPAGPGPALVVILAMIVGCMAGAAISLAQDLLTMRVLEAWQVESVLGIKVLGHTSER